MLRIRIDATSMVAPYEQVRSQIDAAVGDGTLPVGFRLPPVRQLAGDLGLAVNTVARSYRELEAAGLIETRGRLGSFVAATSSPARDALTEVARDYAARAVELGIGAAESLDIVRRAVERVDVSRVDR